MFDLIRHYQKQDPVRPSMLETILVYPGLHAVFFHRINNWLWRHRLRLVSRIGAHLARWVTGVEIHPAAQIGNLFFIDHGMGIVIGQTTIIGNNVTLFHGVTLGGLGIPSTAGTKRHPNLEDGVIIGAGAKILGNITIGKNSKIAPNSVVLENVPANSTLKSCANHIITKEVKIINQV